MNLVGQLRARLDAQVLRLGREVLGERVDKLGAALARARGESREPADDDRAEPNLQPRLYLVCEVDAWDRTQFEYSVPWSEIDERNGFVRLSSAGQVGGTLRRFSGRDRLLLLTIASDRLDAEALGRGLLPRYHSRVPLAAIVAAEVLAPAERSSRELPHSVLARRARPSAA